MREAFFAAASTLVAITPIPIALYMTARVPNPKWGHAAAAAGIIAALLLIGGLVTR